MIKQRLYQLRVIIQHPLEAYMDDGRTTMDLTYTHNNQQKHISKFRNSVVNEDPVVL